MTKLGSVGCDASDECAARATVFRTEIGLDGAAHSQVLVVSRSRVIVESYDRASGIGSRDLLNERSRWWPRNQIAAFRIERSVGSVFLQALIGDAWIDVLRCVNSTHADLTLALPQLQSWIATGDWSAIADEADPTPLRAAERATRARWSSGLWRSVGAAPVAWKTLRRASRLLGPFGKSALALVALSIAAVLVELAPPMLQRYLVDDVLEAGRTASQSEQVALVLLSVVFALLVVRVTATVVGIWKGCIASRVGTTLTSNLREQLVAALHELPIAYYDRHQVGVLMSRVAYDTETMHTLMHHVTTGFLFQVLQMFGIGCMLAYLNAKLAVAAILPMPLMLAGSWYFTRYLHPRHHLYWEAVGRQASALAGTLSGIRVVKAFVQEDRETGRFRRSSHRLRDSRQVVDAGAAVFSGAMGFLFALGGLAVWYVGGRDVLSGDMTLGSLVAFLAYLAMFYAPMTTLAESVTWFSTFLTASERIFDVLDAPRESEAQNSAQPPSEPLGRVEFERVTFAYGTGQPVLCDVSFRIEPGQMIGIVGRSGSGKSTLLGLIARLYPVEQGRVLVDGVDVRQFDVGQLRRRIGMVLQDSYLFHGSIGENIAYGHPNASCEEILRAARYADAHDFILRTRFAYDTLLGESGAGLSGGERQRLSIARALLFDPPILILDEATANVDAESERAIRRAIAHISKSRTTITVAHRLSMVRDADRILVFDQGRLVEHGTHCELHARDGLYRRLSSIQSGANGFRQNGDCAALAAMAAESASHNGLLAADADASRDMASHDDDLALHRNATAEPAQIRWLDRGEVTIEMGEDARLVVRDEGRVLDDVFAVLAFAASHTDEFISLRRRDDLGRETEIGMIRELREWPRAAREAVSTSVARRYLMRQVDEVRNVWTTGDRLTAVLKAGDQLATVQLEVRNGGVQPFGARGLLLSSVDGDLYVVRDRDRLPVRQRHLWSLYVGT